MTVDIEEQTTVEFALSEQQRAVRQAARDFARNEIDPLVEEIDEKDAPVRAVIVGIVDAVR